MAKKFFNSSPYILALVFVSMVFSQCKKDSYSTDAKNLILSEDQHQAMRLLSIDNEADSLFLRKKTAVLSTKQIADDITKHLMGRMLATVTHPDQNGVGIAAPQVGIGVQLVLVQRFDKPDEPFEFYFNPKIEEYSETINAGSEGCLSVPGYRGNVERSEWVKVSYHNTQGEKQTEIVEGFAAIVFQHEIDHLNGILYFDHMPRGFNSLEKTEIE